ALARGNYLHWAWQIKFEAAKNVAHVVDKMLHACGGSGYKRDMELERYLRDAKAGWVMGPTNEVLRQFVGKAVLLGFESLGYWNQSYNRRAGENEVKKLDAAAKRELAEQLMSEASEQEPKEPAKRAWGDGGRHRPVEAPRGGVPGGRPVVRAVLGPPRRGDGAGDRPRGPVHRDRRGRRPGGRAHGVLARRRGRGRGDRRAGRPPRDRGAGARLLDRRRRPGGGAGPLRPRAGSEPGQGGPAVR